VEGAFSLGPLQYLNQDQIRFVEAFIKSRGSLKDVGAELNMSYPTVNSRLNDILIALGHGDRVKVSEPAEPGLSSERKRDILNQVREGQITAAQAEACCAARARERREHERDDDRHHHPAIF
jgi:hypothetical protein